MSNPEITRKHKSLQDNTLQHHVLPNEESKSEGSLQEHLRQPKKPGTTNSNYVQMKGSSSSKKMSAFKSRDEPVDSDDSDHILNFTQSETAIRQDSKVCGK